MRRFSDAQWLAATAILILVGLAIANFGGEDDENGDVAAFVVLGLVSAAIAAGLFLRFVPASRAEQASARRGLVLGAVALLTVIAFWTGLPFALGMPALALGLDGRAGPDAGIAAAAVALGAGAVVLGMAGCILG